MDIFLLSERYRLEIRWNNIEKIQNGILIIGGCYFSGPVLTSAEKIEPNDNIILDFCEQYSAIATNIYTAKFSWEEVEHKENKVFLKNVTLQFNTDVEEVPILKSTDYLVVNTSNHEREIHAFNLLYEAYIINKENKLYDFRK